MEVKLEALGWTLSFWLGQTHDLEDEEDGTGQGDDDEGRPGAGAADRGLDLSTDRDTTDRPHYDAGTVIEQEDRRTGFA